MSVPMKTLVTGVAGIGGEDPVLDFATGLASDLGATLHVVHAYIGPQPGITYVPPVDNPASLAGYGDHVQHKLEMHVRRRHSTVQTVCHAVPETAPRAIREVGERVGADLLVIGATRQGRIGQAILGTTAGRVIRDAQIPVLVMRERPSGPVRRVLLTTDLSELSGRTNDLAIEVVKELFQRGPARAQFHRRDLELRCLLAVWEGVPALGYLADDGPGSSDGSELLRFLSERDSAGLEVAPRVRIGSPVDEILAEAEEWPADLVVLGTQGRAGLSRLIIGSVAETTLRKANRPVLVVPAAATREWAETESALRAGIPSASFGARS